MISMTNDLTMSDENERTNFTNDPISIILETVRQSFDHFSCFVDDDRRQRKNSLTLTSWRLISVSRRHTHSLNIGL